MLRDYVDLKEGDWIIQNGANSAVRLSPLVLLPSSKTHTYTYIYESAGRTSCHTNSQIPRSKQHQPHPRPVRSFHPSLDLQTPSITDLNSSVSPSSSDEETKALKAELTALGATHVLTYTELSSPSTKPLIKSWTSSSSSPQGIKLALNCVSGKPTSLMARLLGPDAHLVSYGAMSKEPLSLPTSLFIFKGLTCHGFWQSRWYKEKGRSEREGLIRELVELIVEGKVCPFLSPRF